jgi:hypothetical protein
MTQPPPEPKHNYENVKFAPGELVVHEKALNRVQRELEKSGIAVGRGAKVAGGFVRVTLKSRTKRLAQEEDIVQTALRALADETLDARPIAEPNYIHGCPQMRGGQYVVPEPRARRDVQFRPSPIGAGVRVAVLDTDFAAFPPLNSAFTGPPLAAPRLTLPATPHELARAAGHSTFVVGQVLRVAPGATIDTFGVLGPGGECTDTDLADTLAAISDDTHLINLSLGTYTVDDQIPYVLEVALERFRERTVVVAAAGNDDANRKWFPAASDDLTISAGAVVRVDGQWARAAFSNYGDWVDFCAPGVVSGPFLEWTDQPQPYGGWAGWAGTSFTTPLITGALAALMSLQNPKDPFAALDTLRTTYDAAPADFINAKVITSPLLWGEAP